MNQISPLGQGRMDPQKNSLLNPDFFLLLTSNLFMWTGVGCFFLLPLFLEQLGANKFDIGILMGTMMLMAVFVRPQASKLVDTVGRKRIFVAGCTINGGVSLMFLFIREPITLSFAPLFLLRLIYGIGFSFGVVASFTLAADLAPGNRLNEGIGLFGTTGLIGIALGPFLAEWIIRRFDFNVMFVFAGLANLISLVALWVMKPEPHEAHRSHAGAFFRTLREPGVLRLVFIGSFFGVGFAAHGGFVTPFAGSLNLFVSYYYIAYSAAAVVARVIGGKAGDQLGERRTIPVALLSAAIGFTLLIYTNTMAGLVVAGFFAGIGHGIIVPGLMAATVRNIPVHSRGKATGVTTGALDSGMFVGSLLLGFVGDRLGYPALFATAALSMGMGLILSFKN